MPRDLDSTFDVDRRSEPDRPSTPSNEPDYAASFNDTIAMLRAMKPEDRSQLANRMWASK